MSSRVSLNMHSTILVHNCVFKPDGGATRNVTDTIPLILIAYLNLRNSNTHFSQRFDTQPELSLMRDKANYLLPPRCPTEAWHGEGKLLQNFHLCNSGSSSELSGRFQCLPKY